MKGKTQLNGKWIKNKLWQENALFLKITVWESFICHIEDYNICCVKILVLRVNSQPSFSSEMSQSEVQIYSGTPFFIYIYKADLLPPLTQAATLVPTQPPPCIYLYLPQQSLGREKKYTVKGTRLKRKGNQILIPLHIRAGILERMGLSHRILIKCRERCRDAIWWSNFSQAGEEECVLSARSTDPASTASLSSRHHRLRSLGTSWQAALVTEKSSRAEVASVSKVFQFVCHADNEAASSWVWYQPTIW